MLGTRFILIQILITVGTNININEYNVIRENYIELVCCIIIVKDFINKNITYQLNLKTKPSNLIEKQRTIIFITE